MAIICDNCGLDVTPNKIEGLGESDLPEYDIVNLDGKTCLCFDCLRALMEYNCSKRHKEDAENLKNEFKAHENVMT